MHPGADQPLPCAQGILWLGFVVWPDHRRVKASKVVQSTRHLVERHAAWLSGEISFGESDANLQGWINHVGHADSSGLRQHVLGQLPLEGRPLRRGLRAMQSRLAKKFDPVLHTLGSKCFAPTCRPAARPRCSCSAR